MCLTSRVVVPTGKSTLDISTSVHAEDYWDLQGLTSAPGHGRVDCARYCILGISRPVTSAVTCLPELSTLTAISDAPPATTPRLTSPTSTSIPTKAAPTSITVTQPTSAPTPTETAVQETPTPVPSPSTTHTAISIPSPVPVPTQSPSPTPITTSTLTPEPTPKLTLTPNPTDFEHRLPLSIAMCTTRSHKARMTSHSLVTGWSYRSAAR